MAAKARFVSDAQLTVIGKRYGSDAVALESNEAAMRWRRDIEALAGYGFGRSVLAEFEADVAQHSVLRASRPEAVADKRSAVVTRDQQVSRGWAWVDRVSKMLGLPARSDQLLANAVAAATPSDDAGLEPGITALASILTETKTLLPGDAQAEDRLAEVDGLCKALRESPGTVQTSKGQTMKDTAQIDRLDGKLMLRIRDLNAAGRAAIRNGHLQASLSEYALHHLKHSGNPAPAPTPKPPATPTS